MVDREGFEPSVPLRVRFLSRELVSATHPPVQEIRKGIILKYNYITLIKLINPYFNHFLNMKCSLKNEKFCFS